MVNRICGGRSSNFILDLTCATPETSFLEPGVGTGLNVLPLVKRGYSVTGIDISKEMLNRFREKINLTHYNLKLLCQDASQLPFPDNSFDVILTVHMIHTVSEWKAFLDDIDRVLKPEGFYLNCQWITPPKRKEFECYFRAILSKFEGDKQQSKYVNAASQEIDVDKYLDSKGYKSSYCIAKQWTVNNTVEELLSFLKLRAYDFCGHGVMGIGN
ncbi:class I SAM-dependent methyltransferase [Scytonema sp. NUACC26]|uniref:class I SAM-dependent methyltransferase n=1 Tax=Scytonema sp. NUACC26 TaxID=3140176 RepID=UPI0034DBB5D0